MKEGITLRVDSKGRICLPMEIRKKIGGTVTIKETDQGYLITPVEKGDFIEAFNKMITSEPKRKAKPKLATPQEMNSIC